MFRNTFRDIFRNTKVKVAIVLILTTGVLFMTMRRNYTEAARQNTFRRAEQAKRYLNREWVQKSIRMIKADPNYQNDSLWLETDGRLRSSSPAMDSAISQLYAQPERFDSIYKLTIHKKIPAYYIIYQTAYRKMRKIKPSDPYK